MIEQQNGAYLALDLGEKRIGIAVTDSSRIVAQPHSVIKRTSRKADFAQIQAIAQEHAVCQIVVGLPVLLSGEEGDMARWARDYGRDLSTQINLPVRFWDETFSSVEAENAMRAQGYNRKKMTGKLDAVAAALILQSVLEADREQ